MPTAPRGTRAMMLKVGGERDFDFRKFPHLANLISEVLAEGDEMGFFDLIQTSVLPSIVNCNTPSISEQ